MRPCIPGPNTPPTVDLSYYAQVDCNFYLNSIEGVAGVFDRTASFNGETFDGNVLGTGSYRAVRAVRRGAGVDPAAAPGAEHQERGDRVQEGPVRRHQRRRGRHVRQPARPAGLGHRGRRGQGQHSHDFTLGTARRVFVSGFDPFGLDGGGILRGNPSGAAALRLDASVAGGAEVQTVIFPVRYDDFDAGLVEEVFTPHLAAGGQQATLITSVSQGVDTTWTGSYQPISQPGLWVKYVCVNGRLARVSFTVT